jgi:tRNA(adenine34) deaminase
MKKNHEQYMRICIHLASLAMENGNPPVGAILVHNDEIIGEGIESGKTTGDITNHAEILAVRDVISKGKRVLLSQSTIYTTHEPCLMCSYLIRHSEIPKIIYGISVDFIGGYTSRFNILNTDENPNWGIKPAVITGICEAECQLLTEQFVASKEKKND